LTIGHFVDLISVKWPFCTAYWYKSAGVRNVGRSGFFAARYLL